MTGKHRKTPRWRRIVFKCWEVTNTHDNIVERFRLKKDAEIFAECMNDPKLYEGAFNGAVYTVWSRDFGR
jgi:hypothetical protein